MAITTGDVKWIIDCVRSTAYKVLHVTPATSRNNAKLVNTSPVVIAIDYIGS
jgi:hypothetical protein